MSRVRRRAVPDPGAEERRTAEGIRALKALALGVALGSVMVFLARRARR